VRAAILLGGGDDAILPVNHHHLEVTYFMQTIPLVTSLLPFVARGRLVIMVKREREKCGEESCAIIATQELSPTDVPELVVPEEDGAGCGPLVLLCPLPLEQPEVELLLFCKEAPKCVCVVSLRGVPLISVTAPLLPSFSAWWYHPVFLYTRPQSQRCVLP
jgi:hypothetical protein